MYSTTLMRWTAALLVASGLLFAVALLLEQATRQEAGPAAMSTAAIVAAPEGTEGHSEAGEVAGHAETPQPAASVAADTGSDHSEAGEVGPHFEQALFGINLEAPWIVWSFVAVSLILAAAVLRFGRPVLPIVLGLAGLAAVLDAREVLSQIGIANLGVAGVAGLVTLVHIATILVAVLAWRATAGTAVV